MSFIKVRDQNGNSPLPEGRLDVALTPDGFNSPQDRRFTDNAGNVSFTGCNLVWPDAHGKFTLEVNTANVNPNYKTSSVTTNDIEANEILITVEKVGVPPINQCPNPNDKNAVSNWFFTLANSVGAHTNTETNRQLMIPSFNSCQVAWQNQNRPPMRARFFLNASGPNLDSNFIVDTGNEGSLFILTFRY